MARLAAPTNVAATQGDTTVVLTWDAVVGAASYSILRSTTESGFGYLIGVTDLLTWDDTTATLDVVYWYSLTARSTTSACGIPSDPVSGFASATPVNIPDAPDDVMAEIV